MASIVVIAELPTLSIVVMQERMGFPSIWTVHAPQSAMPQPNLVPVMPNTSRSTHRTVVTPSTSAMRSRACLILIESAGDSQGAANQIQVVVQTEADSDGEALFDGFARARDEACCSR